MANQKNELKESAFAMFTVEAYSDTDIAERLNVTRKTVRTWRKQFLVYLEKGQELHFKLTTLNRLRLESAIADILTAAKLQERALTSEEIDQLERIKKITLKLY